MLNLVYAPPSARLSGTLLGELAASPVPSVPELILVPRHFSHECERKLCEVCGDAATLKTEVLTLGRLASRVFADTGGAADEYLDDSGRLLIARAAATKVESALRVLAAHIRKPEYMRELVRFIDELESCKITAAPLVAAAEMLGGELGARLGDIALLYAAYRAEMGQRGDPRDMYDRLCGALDGGWARGRRVTVLGFTEFTAQEFEILRILLRDCDTLTVGFEGSGAHFGSAARGEDDPFYALARSADALKNMATQFGSSVSERTLAPVDGARAEALRFIEEHLFCADGALFTGEREPVTLCRERSVKTECERAAAEVLRLARAGYRYRDIAVAVPREGDYRGVLQAVFEAWGIPVFLDNTDDITLKPVIATIFSIADIVRDGFEPQSVLSFLKAGFAPIGFKSACRLENYIYTWNLRGRHWTADADWTFNPRGFSGVPDEHAARELEWLNASRKAVSEPFLRFTRRVARGREYPASTMLREFYTLLDDLRLDRKIAARGAEFAAAGDLKTAAEYAQLWGIVCGLLDSMYSILGDTPIDYAEFASVLKLLLSGTSVGTIPVALDGVAVGDAGRLRHREVKCLLLLGASAGSFPPPVAAGALLSDADRERLGAYKINIQPTSDKLGYRSVESAYAALTLPSERLYISYSGTGAGAASYLTDRLSRMLGIPFGEPSGDERLLAAEAPALELALRAAGESPAGGMARAALTYFETIPAYRSRIAAARAAAMCERGHLSPAAAEALYGGTMALTASRVDAYKDCAHKFFMRYGLRASPRRRAALDRLESGTLLHFVLENTIRDASQSGLLDGDIGEAQKAAARELAYGYLKDYAAGALGGLDGKGALTEFVFGQLKSAAARAVDGVMDEFAVSSFRPGGFELGFGRSEGDLAPIGVGECAELYGKVDRVDTWRHADGRLFLRVMDYKSGNTKFDLAGVYHGSRIQLLIYMFALEQRGAQRFGLSPTGAGVLYSPAGDRTASIPRSKLYDGESAEQLQRSGLILDDRDVVEAMERGATKRFLPVVINRDGSFGKRSWVADRQSFELLSRHVTRTLESVADSVTGGDIAARPTYIGNRSACEFCDFAEACRYDETNGIDCNTYVPRMKKEEFWQRLAADDEGGTGK